MLRLLACLALAVCGLVTTRAVAQEAPPAQAATAAPDIVRLRDGSMVRGTIAELVAGQHVVLITLTGETRTYPMAEVDYAGPASGATAAPASTPAPAATPAGRSPTAQGDGETRPFVTVHAGEARLRLLGTEPGLTYHVRTGTATATGYSGGAVAAVRADAYTEICTAPCDASLPNGSHTLALSREEGTPISAGRIEVGGPTTLEGTYIDRSGLRIGGWVVFLGGTIGGTAIMLSGIGEEDSTTTIGIGGGIMLAGTIVGLIMAMQGDGAEIVRR